MVLHRCLGQNRASRGRTYRPETKRPRSQLETAATIRTRLSTWANANNHTNNENIHTDNTASNSDTGSLNSGQQLCPGLLEDLVDQYLHVCGGTKAA